jgi:hypothetical protein
MPLRLLIRLRDQPASQGQPLDDFRAETGLEAIQPVLIRTGRLCSRRYPTEVKNAEALLCVLF